MRLRSSLAGAAVTAAIFMGAGSAAFAGPAWEFTSPGNDFSDGTWDFATAFTVNNAITASGLGYYASPTNGQVNANPVNLYQCADVSCNSTATLIASATVTNLYALNGHFRYVTISPLTLQPGVGYEVAGVSNGDNYTWNDNSFHTDSDVNITSIAGVPTRWQSLGTPSFLNSTATFDIENDGFWGPNVYLGSSSGFTGGGGIPEPATWALLLGGVGMVGVGVRHNRRKAASTVPA